MTVVPKLVFASILVTILTEHHCKHAYEDVSPTLEKQLNREERKSACCAKKMRCCKKHLPPPNVEIRAVIARCIDSPPICSKNRNIKKPLNRGNMNNLEKFQGFDEDEPLVQSEVTKCTKKLILTIKMKNEGESNTKNQYIVIDHVYDPISDKTVRLLNPYVIKMRQEHLSQAYGLKFVDFVNSQAKEQVYNKHDGNYTGCCMDEKKPTCGIVAYRGRTVPYSGGFCCSCDAEKNAQRQPQADPNTVIAYSDPAYLYDAVQCPRTNLKFENKHSKDKVDTKKGSKGKVKDHHKRHMETNSMYYIDPKINYKQGCASKQRKSKDINNFDTENNYKIQSMNDEYEDQLTDKRVIPNQLSETIRFNEAHDENKLKDNRANIRHSDGRNIKKNTNKIQKYYSENRTHASVNSRNKASKTEKTEKPSMHKILHFDNAYSRARIYDINNNIKSIADQAFKAAIKFQDIQTNTENLRKHIDSLDKKEHINWLDIPHSKRQVQPSGVQKRGGQNCADRYTPPNLNSESYHESTHCLRFSPIWYGVYKLETPVVEQETIFQIFEKYETEAGAVKWKDLTKGKKVKLGTFWPYYKDELPTISMTFNSVMDDQDFCIDWSRLRLLIPEGVETSEMSKYPESRGGPAEFLMVPNEKIVLTGDQCNVAGVGFEAFFRQPNRCSMSRGSCLHHQPYHLWHYDKTLERNGKRGCYFLKHHGKLSKNPIRKNSTSEEKFLTLNYYGRYVSMIDMEINADFNAVLRPTSSAVITEVYIDSTCKEKTTVTVKVSNSGLLSSKFMVRVCDCPLDLQGKLNDVQSEIVIVPPQQQHIFKLMFYAVANADIFHCSVEALNENGELVALRRIKIQKLDRCICTWHCLCACIGSASGLKCIPMKMDHYHAAGFKGGLPIITHVDHETLTNDVYRLIIFIISFIFFTLFILGLTKAILGLCCLPIGMWGLNVLLDLPKPMNKYYEKSLRDRTVVYDQDGWPIHPDNREKVRNIPKTAEFCTNVLFFYSYPTVVFVLVLKKICCPYYAYETIKKRKSKKDKWQERHKCKVKTCFYKKKQTDESGSASGTSKTHRWTPKKASTQTSASGQQTEGTSASELEGPATKKKRPSWIRRVLRKTKSTLSPRGHSASPGEKKSKSPMKTKEPKKVKETKKTKQRKDSKETKKTKESKQSKTAKTSEPPKSKSSIKSKSSHESILRTSTQDQPHKETSKSDTKKKPAIKVSIRERPKSKSQTSTPNKQNSIEISDNPYYYSSTDDASTYSESTASSPPRRAGRRGSNTST